MLLHHETLVFNLATAIGAVASLAATLGMVLVHRTGRNIYRAWDRIKAALRPTTKESK